MNHIKSINELFGFRKKKKFTQENVDAIKSLLQDFLDDIGISENSVAIESIIEDDASVDFCLRLEYNRDVDLINSKFDNFTIKLNQHYKIISGEDYYRKFKSDIFSKGFIIRFRRNLDEGYGLLRFKILNK